ncbi:MAG: DUF4880 domain-containing protein [Novosphingobium sp.]
MNDQQRQGGIEQEAAEWLAALDSGRADRAAFEAWRAADPAHAVAFVRADRTWRQLDRLSRIAALPGVDSAEESGESEQSARPGRRSFIQAAGLGALVVGSGTIFAVQQAAAHVVETAVGERRRLYIDEKTCLNLNTATRVRWWRGGKGFEITLERGQASFDLARGARLCTVRAGPLEMTLGAGAFDVLLLSPEKVNVVAIHGDARLLTGLGGGAVKLHRREQLAVSDKGIATPVTISDDAVQVRSAWREGELIFEGQTLTQAVAEYNRYLRKPMALADPKLGSLRLGGRFPTDDPTEFLDALRANFGLRVEVQSDRITLHS